MINIALPKGRMGDAAYRLFHTIGLKCHAMEQDSRKLVLESSENGVRYLMVKPADVAIYVERGAADLGIVGKDVLLETEPSVYELLDLKMGSCRFAVAAPNDFCEDTDAILRVATKYPHVAKQYYKSINRDIEIIKLNGSIELAPLSGLSDVIVDIVETGTTLRENNLSVVDTIAPSSARLIANVAVYKFKQKQLDEMVKRLAEVVA